MALGYSDNVHTHVGDVTIRGAKVPFYVQLDVEGGQARFYATVDGTKHTADTAVELKEQIAKATQKTVTRIELPLTRVNGRKVEQVTITGIHGGTGNLMVRRDGDSRSEQDSSWSGHWWYMARMTAAQIGEYLDLVVEAEEAEKARKAFVDAHKVDAKVEATKLLQKQIGGE